MFSKSSFGGLQVFVSAHAVQTRPIFPDKKPTKRRRRRVIGKFGGWTKDFPAAFQAGPALYVHPKIYAELKRNQHA
jgi:hypothetical protein